MWPILVGLASLVDMCDTMAISTTHADPETALGQTSTLGQSYTGAHVDHVAVAKDIRGDLLREFSPVIYLHPNDQYLPADPALTFRKYYNATTDDMSIPPSELAGMPLSYADKESLDHVRRSIPLMHHPSINQSSSPAASVPASPTNTSTEEYNDFHRPGARSGAGRVTAPVTAQARLITRGRDEGKIALQYWYWHNFNGAQGFSVKESKSKSNDPRASGVDADGVTRWEWWPLAIHNADWEHTTIMLSPVSGRRLSHLAQDHLSASSSSSSSSPTLMSSSPSSSDWELESVYYTVHAEQDDRVSDFPREGNHPVVYSHLNSHACYAVPGDHWNTDPGFDGFINTFIRTITFGRIQQVKIIDIGFREEEAIKWTDYDIYDVSDATEGIGPDWALWKGHWGDPVDQTRPDPPPAFVPSRRSLRFTLWLLRISGKLTRFVRPMKRAPRGPIAHWNWRSLDILSDNWVPRTKAGPSFLAIAGFLACVGLAIGVCWALLSSMAVLFVIATRLLVRRVRRGRYGALSSTSRNARQIPGVDSAPWQVHKEFREGSDDELAATRLLSDDTPLAQGRHRSRPSESLDMEHLQRRRFAWLRDKLIELKKGLISA